MVNDHFPLWCLLFMEMKAGFYFRNYGHGTSHGACPIASFFYCVLIVCDGANYLPIICIILLFQFIKAYHPVENAFQNYNADIENILDSECCLFVF